MIACPHWEAVLGAWFRGGPEAPMACVTCMAMPVWGRTVNVKPYPGCLPAHSRPKSSRFPSETVRNGRPSTEKNTTHGEEQTHSGRAWSRPGDYVEVGVVFITFFLL